MALVESILYKGSKSECKNYRAISLSISIPGKVFRRVWIYKVKRRKIRFGICKVGSWRKGLYKSIFCLKQVIEKYTSVKKSLHCTFVDLEKAYDKVNKVKLWRLLDEYGVEKCLVNSIKGISMNK